MSDGLSNEAMTEAIDRIARTADGGLLYRYLQRRRMEVGSADPVSTLQTDHGERRFAAHLMKLMSEGMAESGGRTSSSGSGTGGNPEQPIIFAAPKPVRTGGDSRGASRRVGPNTRVPGYDLPDDT